MAQEIKDFQPLIDAASDLARCKMNNEGKNDNETWFKYFFSFLKWLIPWKALGIILLIFIFYF